MQTWSYQTVFLLLAISSVSLNAGNLNLNEIFKPPQDSTTNDQERRSRPRRYVRSIASSVRLTMPAVDKQDDSWSCGINSSARVLKYYGHDVSYKGLREKRKAPFQASGPVEKVLNATPIIKKIPHEIPIYKLGTKPTDVRNILRQYRRNVWVRKHTSLSLIKAVLQSNRPVITLIRPSKKTFEAGPIEIQLPTLHWIVVSGYDRDKALIYYYDTYANDERSMTEKVFLEKWDWDIPGMGALGVHSRTVVY